MKDYYNAPRITYEYPDCSMPITFDQYSNCGYKCAYCFSQYQRGIGNGQDDYKKNKVKQINLDKVKNLFLLKKENNLNPWIRAKKPIQWGGLSDPFCPFEEKYGVGLELLKFFNEIKQPISFSSKSDLLLRDEGYFNEFKKAGNLWHYKASIITLDEKKSRLVEAGTPTPQRRIEVLKKLSSIGTLTTWRMRPFIVGITDLDMEEQIKTAKEIGCQSITTEFYCIDLRSLSKPEILKNYNKISVAINQNIIRFYQKFGRGSGYKRLKIDFCRPYVRKYINLCKKYDIPYFISDANFKNFNCSGSCCGLLNSNKEFEGYAKRQMTYLMLLAKKNGYITIDDYKNQGDQPELDFRKNTKVVSNRNFGDSRERCYTHKNMSIDDYFVKMWNKGFFESYFGGILEAKKKDNNGNVIYFYNYKKTTI